MSHVTSVAPLKRGAAVLLVLLAHRSAVPTGSGRFSPPPAASSGPARAKADQPSNQTSAVLAAAPVPPDAAGPKKLGLEESVEVSLVQLEVTVWPKKAEETDACLGLTAEDFELIVDGKPQPIYAVDSLGAEQEVYVPDTRLETEPPAGGLSIVLFFDLWHIDLFYRSYPDCPMTKPLAFREARRYVREEFHDGDRLLLVTAAGWPVVHDGWIRSPAEALGALDRLENSPQVLAARQDHLHHRDWIAGMESFLLALGRYRGRKDVIYLADDFREPGRPGREGFDDVALKMYDIAGRAQSNGVVVNAVDLVASCRKIPGPGRRGCPTFGGLGCTEFSSPVALNPISRDTGGELFQTERIDFAARALRSMRKCRYVVSFHSPPRKRKGAPSVELNLRGERKDLSLSAPSSFETPERAPSRRERDEALFLLPRFGSGISADVALWPYRPAGKGGRWKAFVLARVERADDEPWPDELREISVNVIPHRQSREYGEFRKTITGEDLTNLRYGTGKKLLLFPIEAVRPGEATVDLTVTSNVEEISANVRRTFDVPELPGPGEARPWFLSDRVVRFKKDEVMAPSLDDVAEAGQPVSFVGFACREKGSEARSYAGRLISSDGGAPVPVPLSWLDASDGPRDGCGWLRGRTRAPDRPGLWTFEPPLDLGGRKGKVSVEFSVVPATAPPAPPAEAEPR